MTGNVKGRFAEPTPWLPSAPKAQYYYYNRYNNRKSNHRRSSPILSVTPKAWLIWKTRIDIAAKRQVTNKLRGQYRTARRAEGGQRRDLDRVVATTGMGRSTASGPGRPETPALTRHMMPPGVIEADTVAHCVPTLSGEVAGAGAVVGAPSDVGDRRASGDSIRSPRSRIVFLRSVRSTWVSIRWRFRLQPGAIAQ